MAFETRSCCLVFVHGPATKLGRRRFIRHLKQYVRDQIRNRVHPLGIDPFRVVAGSVVVLMFAGVEHQEWNLFLEERVMVAIIGNAPGEKQRQSGTRVPETNQLPQTKRGARAKYLDARFVETATARSSQQCSRSMRILREIHQTAGW